MENNKTKILLFNIKNMHHKNLESLLQYNKIIFEHIDDISKINNQEFYDAIYSPIQALDIKTLPTNLKSNTKYIFGPHFSVFPNKEQLLPIINENTIYIQPSIWACNVWKNDKNFPNGINIQPIPFCINVTKFKPIKEISERNEIFVYYKNREPDEINYILNHFIKENQPIKLFNYKKGYNENEYIEILNNAKYGIWVGAHESQGFALEEALSCDVPLLVWNVKTLNQEYGSNYPNYNATTIPYWDKTCGEVFYEKNEFIDKLNLLKNNITTYKPREFILNNLSIEKCQNQFLKLIHTPL